MTVYNITPADSIQAVIDAGLAPGDQIVLASGIYTETLIFDGVEGAADNKIILRGPSDATITGAGTDKDTIRMSGCKHIALVGFTAIGCDAALGSGQEGVIHAHKSGGVWCEGLVFSGLDVFPTFGDGIKISETIGTQVIWCNFHGSSLQIVGESHLDANKFDSLLVEDCTFADHPKTAVVLKGDGRTAWVQYNGFTNNSRCMEIGGYQGSGYWAGYWPDAAVSAARYVALAGNTFARSNDKGLRFIDARDCHITDAPTDTNRNLQFTDGDLTTENIWVDGDWNNGVGTWAPDPAPEPYVVPPIPVEPIPPAGTLFTVEAVGPVTVTAHGVTLTIQPDGTIG